MCQAWCLIRCWSGNKGAPNTARKSAQPSFTINIKQVCVCVCVPATCARVWELYFELTAEKFAASFMDVNFFLVQTKNWTEPNPVMQFGLFVSFLFFSNNMVSFDSYIKTKSYLVWLRFRRLFYLIWTEWNLVINMQLVVLSRVQKMHCCLSSSSTVSHYWTTFVSPFIYTIDKRYLTGNQN